VREQLHPECARARADFLADAAEPDHAECLAAQFRARELLLVPDAALHGGICRRNGAGKREQQRKCKLRDADAVRAGRIHHYDAARCRCRHIHVVNASARTGDHPKIRRRLDQRGVGSRRAPHDERVGIREIAREIFRRAPGSQIDAPSWHTAEDCDG
jgi:hypothetical protein